MDKKIKNKLADVMMFFYRIIKNIFLIENGSCKYIPSCSEYAHEALIKLPIHIALVKIFIRVIKCNPFSKGGYYPLIENEERK